MFAKVDQLSRDLDLVDWVLSQSTLEQIFLDTWRKAQQKVERCSIEPVETVVEVFCSG